MDEPEEHGLREISGTAAAAAWEVADDATIHRRQGRLEARGVLEAAGVLVHHDQFV